MKNFRLIGLMLLILMLGNSCKTYKNLERVEPKNDSASIAEQVQKLKPGNLIMVFEKSGSIKMMEYVITEEGVLRGFGTKGTQEDLISIRLEDIIKIEVKKFNLGKTALTTAAVIAGAYLITGIVLLAASGAQ